MLEMYHKESENREGILFLFHNKFHPTRDQIRS